MSNPDIVWLKYYVLTYLYLYKQIVDKYRRVSKYIVIKNSIIYRYISNKIGYTDVCVNLM